MITETERFGRWYVERRSTATLAEPMIEIRSGEGYDIAEVNLPKRIVTCVAMPYERISTTALYRGRRIIEVVSRGAFTGIEKRAGKIKANRDHSWDKPVGKIVALHPSRSEGLVAEVRVSPTPLGEETLTLCDEGVLGASAGFALLRRDDGRVYDDAEVWEHNRTVRRLNRLRLDHLAFVPDPAYDDATVLSVRQAAQAAQEAAERDATPNRDRVELDALKAAHDALNRRWASG